MDISNSLSDSLTDSLSRLPIDIFIQQITYLPYDEVMKICQLNQKLHIYCTSYPIKWKALIQNTFGSLPLYTEILKEIHQDLGNETYDYLVYTQFTKYLDPTTKLLIYDQQKDSTNFDKLFAKADTISKLMYWYRKGDYTRFRLQGDPTSIISSLWLIGDNSKLFDFIRTLTDPDDIAFSKYFIRVIKGTARKSDFNEIAIFFIEEGNLKGLKKIVRAGADINKIPSITIHRASSNLDMLKYILANKKLTRKERNELNTYIK